MTEKEYRARIVEIETENSQLEERLSSEVSEVERLTDDSLWALELSACQKRGG